MHILLIFLSIVSHSATKILRDDGYFAFDSSLYLKNLRGRPVLVKDSHQILLQRINVSLIRSRTYLNSNGTIQCIVRVDQHHRNDFHKYIKDISEYTRYIPHDTFLVYLLLKDLEKILHISNGEVFEVPSQMKISPQIFSDVVDSLDSFPRYRTDFRNAQPSTVCVPRQLIVLLTSSLSRVSNLKEQMDSLCSEIRRKNESLCSIISGSATRKKLVVDTSDCDIREVARRIAELSAVAWVEARATMRLHNKYATRITQSYNGSSHVLWMNGLQGDGEVRSARKRSLSPAMQLHALDNNFVNWADNRDHGYWCRLQQLFFQRYSSDLADLYGRRLCADSGLHQLRR